jgi:Ni,Fe-hydrogenase III large subunit
MILAALGLETAGSGRWPRRDVGADIWQAACEGLTAGRWSLTGLWGDDAVVHMALIDQSDTAILTLACPDGRFPSVATHHAPAIRPERALCDLFGFTADGAPDPRPWLDHGRWGIAHPLGDARATPGAPEPYSFLAAEGDDLHQVPVGPIHAGIIEPGHFRFHCFGETVVRLETRFGYAHKGIDALMRGAPLDRAAQLVGRISGDSTVAYALAFSRAVEKASGIEAPPRAQWLRGLMAELERLANHLGDVGGICNDAAFPLLAAHGAMLREEVLRASGDVFGHRMMRDMVLPGGVALDLDAAGAARLRALADQIERRFAAIVTCYDGAASLQDRTVGTGRVASDLARRFGAGGYVGRASGRGFDARRALPYAPYDSLSFEVPVLNDGDVNARVWIRIHEVGESLALLRSMLDRLPDGPIATAAPARPGEGCALVEGFRGDILAWVRLNGDGRVTRCHLRDPSWFQWPLVEAAVEGNIIADFPLCNKSFNCAYSGCDL